MHVRRCLCLVFAAACLSVGPRGVRAQRPAPVASRPPYVEIPFEQNLDRALVDQVLILLERLKSKPGALERSIKDLDLNRPESRPEIEKLLKKLHLNQDKKTDFDNVLKERAKQVPQERKRQMAPMPPSSPGPAGMPADVTPQRAPAAAMPLPEDDTLARWTRDLIDQMRESEYGEMVMQSPALRRGLEDLRKLLADGDAGQVQSPPPPALARWAEKLRPSKLPKLPDLSWLKPQALLPNRPNVRLPSVTMPASIPRLALGLPRWGTSGPSTRALGSGLLWIGVLALAALVCWLVLRRWSVGTRVPTRSQSLGPWPVEPGNVMTPAELILAFEYLSLLRLGPDARSWNHRLIAANLCAGKREDQHFCQAADELAGLYERARYAPATEPIPGEALASARRDLRLLAGVASA